MKNVVSLVAVAALVLISSGCTSGPLSQWFRGAPCSACNPGVSLPHGCNSNTATGCDSGVCGSGVNTQPGFGAVPNTTGYPVYPEGSIEQGYQGEFPNGPIGPAPGYQPQMYGQPDFNAAPLVDPFGQAAPQGGMMGIDQGGIVMPQVSPNQAVR